MTAAMAILAVGHPAFRIPHPHRAILALAMNPFRNQRRLGGQGLIVNADEVEPFKERPVVFPGAVGEEFVAGIAGGAGAADEGGDAVALPRFDDPWAMRV